MKQFLFHFTEINLVHQIQSSHESGDVLIQRHNASCSYLKHLNSSELSVLSTVSDEEEGVCETKLSDDTSKAVVLLSE